MISNKTLATIFLITLNMQRAAASSSSSTQGSSSSDTFSPVIKIQKLTPRPKKNVLHDMTSTAEVVGVQGGSNGEMSTSQEQPVPQVNEELEALIKLAEKMDNEEFLKRLCPVIRTLDQYKGIADYLKRRNLVASFYIFGNIQVVKEAIIESVVYDGDNDYVEGGDLETALSLALEKDCHDRFMDLLSVRKGITAKVDEQCKSGGKITSFERFVSLFLYHLAPWKDGMTLRRFFTLRGDKLRDRHPDILDTLCQELVGLLRVRLHLPKAESLLVDLIGQPSLLTPVAFARGFLQYDTDETRFIFIRYGWREAIQEGLKSEHHGGGIKLWRVIQKVYPDQFLGEFPPTAEALDDVLMYFPSKQQMEEEWAKKNAEMLSKKVKSPGFTFDLP